MAKFSDDYKCVVCEESARGSKLPGQPFVTLVECARCGRFQSVDQDGKVSGYEIPDERRHLISAFLWKHWDETGKSFKVSDRKGSALPSDFDEPSVTDKIIRALVLVAKRSKSFGAQVRVSPTEFRKSCMR